MGQCCSDEADKNNAEENNAEEDNLKKNNTDANKESKDDDNDKGTEVKDKEPGAEVKDKEENNEGNVAIKSNGDKGPGAEVKDKEENNEGTVAIKSMGDKGPGAEVKDKEENNEGNVAVKSMENKGPGTEVKDKEENNEGTAEIKREEKKEDGPVIRYEIREMSKEDQMRFVKAVKKCMENRDGPETSEWFRIAGMHGWPNSYCHHGKENFPSWHRAYLVELEIALQNADKALGNDGKIGVPYWDWNMTEINGEIYPQILVDEFPALPKDFLKEENQDRLSKGFTRYSIQRIARNLKNANLKEQAYRSLEERQHWKAASTRWRGNSVESPHNSVHVCCGFPMATVAYAGFDPTFWLHHCNVDRLYEAYIKEHPDSRQEFIDNQLRLEQQGHENRYTGLLEPFTNPFTGKPFHNDDCFDTVKIGYKYDKLIEPRPQQMREIPTYAVFPKVDIMQMNGKTYILDVFVVKTDDEKDWAPPDKKKDWDSHPSWGGIGAIFGRGSDCPNCETRAPFTVRVDITQTLRQLNLSRADASIRVMTVDENGEVAPLENTPVPIPIIEGPYFESADLMQAQTTADENKEKNRSEKADILQTQKLLKKFGWYNGEADGWYGEKTALAIKEFQTRFGLKVDSIAGPKTREMLISTRFDDEMDEVKSSESEEKKSETGTYKRGENVLYWVGMSPGNMKHQDVLSDVAIALNQWSECTGITFTKTEDHSKSKLNLSWNEDEEHLFRFDGPGGALAHAGFDPENKVGFVHFDIAERWVTQTQLDQSQPNDFVLLPVVLHELGHVLGLRHSIDTSAVMSPYYVKDRVELTSADISAVETLYPKD